MIKPFTKVEKSLVFLRVKESGIYISKDLNPYIDTDSTSTLTPIEGGVETVEGELVEGEGEEEEYDPIHHDYCSAHILRFFLCGASLWVPNNFCCYSFCYKPPAYALPFFFL